MLKRVFLVLIVSLAPLSPAVSEEGSHPIEPFEIWKPVTHYVPDGWRIVNLSKRGGSLRMTVSRSEGPHAGKGALRIVSKNPDRFKAPGFSVRNIHSAGNWNQYAGISFWVKGDGSKYYASIVLGTGKEQPMDNGYEAIFPLSETTWHKVTLRWEDFVQNPLPWSKKKDIRITAERLRLDPTKVTQIGFGHGRYFWSYNAPYSMEIDEVRIEKNLSARKMPAKFTTGLARTAGLLKAGKPLKILALGDSITWRGRKKSYAYYLGLKLKEKFKSDVTDCNRAIAGYTARGGAISLPRDIRAMPDPDLVFIFFGANDAKAIGNGLTEAGFAAHIGDLIDRVRIATGGRPDFMVITGVPRMFNSSDPVGKIVKGAIQAARDKQATVCDTYPVFLQMPKEERKKYISGAPHISDGGQQKMADLVFDRICALIDQ